MAVESAADRAAFFDTDDFGETVTITPQGGGAAYEVSAIVSDKQAIDGLGEFGAVTAATYLHARTEDLPNLAVNDHVTVGGTAYKVASGPISDGQGTTQASLRRET